MVTSKAEVRDEMRGQLFEPQRKLVERIKASFANNEPVAICAGTRSGKTFMETVLSFDFEHVMLVGWFGGQTATLQQLKCNAEMMRLYHQNEIHLVSAPRFFELPVKSVTPNTLIILEEAFWWSPNMARKPGDRGPEWTTAEDFFTEVCKLTKNVLAMSSRGPGVFKNTPMTSYATWELNTSITRQMLEPEFVFDHDAATRDFGG